MSFSRPKQAVNKECVWAYASNITAQVEELIGNLL